MWVVLTAFIQAPTKNTPKPAEAAELSALESVWNEAHLRGDVNALDRLWADDLIVTVPNMPVMTKENAIGISRSGRLKFKRYETSDIRIRLYGEAAVVTGQVERTRELDGRDVHDKWRFTKVYIRREGRWQVVAWHASTVEQ
jgi:ketosteroid isomerase-like protein